MTRGSWLALPRLDAHGRALPMVLALWAAMTAILLGCIAVYGHDVPLSEDWDMVPALVGRQPDLLGWLWAQNNEHRLPLQKAVYLFLLKISGGDFRVGMLADTLMLSGLCLAMILTARRLRGGQTRLADAFFPLVLLHPGHMENLIWGWEIQFVISTGLVILWLLIIIRETWPLPPKIALGAGSLLLLLPLCGANGVIFTPFAAFWLATGTALFCRETAARWIVPFHIACVAVSIALAGLYIAEYEQDLAHPNPGFWPTVLTGIRFVGIAIGPAGAGTVPPKLFSGILFCSITFILLALTIIPLRIGLRRARGAERFRLYGLLIFAAAMAALVVAIAWGRAGWVPRFGIPDRYALFSVPGLCAAYFAWILYGPELLRDRIAVAFAAASLAALPLNLREGNWWRWWYAKNMTAFEQDLAAGLPWRELGDRHYDFLLHWNRDALVERMQMLHNAKIGPLGRAEPR